MKLSCLQDSLAEGLGVVGRAVPTKSTLAILGNVLLATDGGSLKLSGTNLEVAITRWIAASIEEEGQVTLPSRLLADFVGLLDKGQKVEMQLNPKNLRMHLKCGRFEANIAGQDADDFPVIPQVGPEAPRMVVEAPVLKTAIEQVVFAAATDDSRPVLAGVLLAFRHDRLTLAAADGFRLAVRTVDLAAPAEEDLAIIVPARTLAELARLLPASEGDQVEIAATPGRGHALFRFSAPSASGGPGQGQTEVVSRLVEGQFPDYERIIPRDFRTRVVVERSRFLQATRVASAFSRDNSYIVRLQMSAPGEDLVPGKMTVAGNSAELGDNQGDLDATVQGESAEIAFNGQYLRDALEAIASPQVGLEINTPSSPGVLRPVGADSDSHLQVIMPMHISR